MSEPFDVFALPLGPLQANCFFVVGADAGLVMNEETAPRTACLIGSAINGVDAFRKAMVNLLEKGPLKISPYLLPNLCANLPSGKAGMLLGFTGPVFSPQGASASGNHAIGIGARMIRDGDCDFALAGGVDTPILPEIIHGFTNMNATIKVLPGDRAYDDPAQASRPFSADRRGFVLSEGAGVLVLAAEDTLARFDASPPDALVLIDYPGFNLRLAHRAHCRGIPIIALTAHAMSDDRSRALATSLGCDCVFDLTLSAKQDGDLSPHGGRITREQLEQFIAENEDDYFASVISCIGASERAELREQRPCSAGISTCSINPYGDVFPCVQLCCIIGNTRRSPFGEIWRDSPAVKKLRGVRFADLKDCNACPNVVHCLRCPGLALLEDGDLLGRSTEACRQAEAYRRVHEQHERLGAVS